MKAARPASGAKRRAPGATGVVVEDVAVGRRIAARRRAIGATQEDAAAYVGVSQSLFAYWEKGDRRVPASRLPALAQFLKTGVAELLVGEGAFSKAALDLARLYDSIPSEGDRSRLRQFATALVSSRRY